MRHRLTLIFSLMLISCFSAFGERKFHHAVKEAVMAEMKAYPKSTLKDIYKNFSKTNSDQVISSPTLHQLGNISEAN